MIDSNRLDNILVSHYKKYPRIQIQDMVKLIYQNEFAGGHLINNKAESLERLKDELAGIQGTSRASAVGGGAVEEMSSRPETGSGACGETCRKHEKGIDRCGDMDGKTDPETGSELFEDIGNGLCRLNLRVLRNHPVNLETINEFFVYTATSNKGSMLGLERKLGVLRDLCECGRLPYTVSDIDDYLLAYKDKGCPALSHSESYRNSYSPAYRVLSSVFRDYFKVFCKIDTLLNGLCKQPYGTGLDAQLSVSVAVDGNSGAGKSSLAALLQEVYDCNVFHMDHFFLTPDLRTEERLKEAGGNVDYVRFKNEVIDGLRSGKEFSYQIYDCSKGMLDQIVNVVPKRLNIIEGSYSMHPTLAQSYDLRIFLGIGAEEQSRRILERNGPFMHSKFISLWIPLENRYFSELDIPQKCDIVITRR